MKKTLLLMLVSLAILSLPVLAFSKTEYPSAFHLVSYAPSQMSAFANKYDGGEAMVHVRVAEHFDNATDDVYYRVRTFGEEYASEYLTLGDDFPIGGRGYADYLAGKEILGNPYRLFANMYSTVPGGYIDTKGTWYP